MDLPSPAKQPQAPTWTPATEGALFGFPLTVTAEQAAQQLQSPQPQITPQLAAQAPTAAPQMPSAQAPYAQAPAAQGSLPSPHAYLPAITSAGAISDDSAEQITVPVFTPVPDALAQFTSAKPVPVLNKPARGSGGKSKLFIGVGAALCALVAAGGLLVVTAQNKKVKTTFNDLQATLPGSSGEFATPSNADTVSGDTEFVSPDAGFVEDVVTPDAGVVAADPTAAAQPVAVEPATTLPAPVEPAPAQPAAAAPAPTVAPPDVAPAAFGADGFLLGSLVVEPRVCGNNQPGAYQVQFASCAAAHNIKILRSMAFPTIAPTNDETLLAECRAELVTWLPAEQGLGVIERISYPQADGGVLQVCFVRYA
jgi:hypothetical protein